ncbi:M50 family metallopeptidase [Streptomyces sp. NPDC127084]|uniref:M50 family metallopeptidase n=1 Tax=Streptomyces sp. NPDC127084 TaxID=3347133 RepID=UPI003659A018
MSTLLLIELGALTLSWPELATDCLKILRHPALLLWIPLLLLLSTALHELAHGLAGRWAGATVTEIGIAWHFPAVFPYCKVEGADFLTSRRQRAVIVAAGPCAGLLTMLPALLLWWWGNEGAFRTVASGLLVAGSFTTAWNLLPLPGLDGYRILSALLNMTELAPESRRYRTLLRRRQNRDRATITVKDYPGWAGLVYRNYPIVAVSTAAVYGYVFSNEAARAAAELTDILFSPAIAAIPIGVAAGVMAFLWAESSVQ